MATQFRFSLLAEFQTFTPYPISPFVICYPQLSLISIWYCLFSPSTGLSKSLNAASWHTVICVPTHYGTEAHEGVEVKLVFYNLAVAGREVLCWGSNRSTPRTQWVGAAGPRDDDEGTDHCPIHGFKTRSSGTWKVTVLTGLPQPISKLFFLTLCFFLHRGFLYNCRYNIKQKNAPFLN